jgi:hypothetical protein
MQAVSPLVGRNARTTEDVDPHEEIGETETPEEQGTSRPNRKVLFALVGAGVVLAFVVLAIALGGGQGAAEEVDDVTSPPTASSERSSSVEAPGEGPTTGPPSDDPRTDEAVSHDAPSEETEDSENPAETVGTRQPEHTVANPMRRRARPAMMRRSLMMTASPMRVFGDPDF